MPEYNCPENITGQKINGFIEGRGTNTQEKPRNSEHNINIEAQISAFILASGGGGDER